MKTQTQLLLLVTSLTLSACATTTVKQTDHAIVQEAKQEAPLEGVVQVQNRFMEILDEDKTVTPAEKEKIKTIVKNSFERYRELEVLSNQKKSLLVKETLQKTPNRKKITQIRNALRNSYEERTNLMLTSFDDISKVLKLHPESASRFSEKSSLMWPIRDRSP